MRFSEMVFRSLLARIESMISVYWLHTSDETVALVSNGQFEVNIGSWMPETGPR